MKEARRQEELADASDSKDSSRQIQNGRVFAMIRGASVGCRRITETSLDFAKITRFETLIKDMATFTGMIGSGSKWLLDRIVSAVAATGINPNFLTFLGLVVNFIAAAFFAVGSFFTGALIILFAGFLDMLDGQVARKQNRVTAFGAFYDSTLDRYADMALYMGLLVYYSVSGRTPYVILAAVATAGSVMVSYARARAESLIPLCKVGFMERPERLVLLIIGGLFNRMGPVLWVIAVVSTITVIHRIYYTWQETRAGRTLPGIKLSL
jgi:CDP-diacylglycerol---glycerol-3-phosphate 3-phosphatidyltransferase